MNKRMMAYGLSATILGWCALAAAGPRDPVAAIEKQLAEKWAKVKTMSGKMTMKADIPGDGGSSKTDSTGTYEYRRMGDKMAYRMDAQYTMVNNYGGQEMRMESNSTSICDGDYMYILNERMGQKTAMKMKADPKQSIDPRSTLAALREHNTLKVLPDETLDGEAVFVIEATTQNAASSPMPRTVMYISKDTGVVLKTSSFDRAGKEVSTVRMSDIKINEDIPAARFEFEPPPGVTVTDMTGGE